MKLHKILITLLSAITISSCTSGFEEMNKDPMAVNEISPSLSLPNMQYHGFHIVYGDYQRAALLYSFLYCQYLANTSSSFTSGNYVFNTSWAERGLWTPYYQQMVKRIREIEPTLENHPEYNDMYQIMRINLAISTIRMTDTFGDIPYFKAGRGETLIPYDSQKDIYYDVFRELTEAVTELKQKKSNQLQYNTEDLIYQGDVDKWIKLANSLRLRAAMRLSFIDPDKAKAEGEAALKESLIASNSDNAGVTPPQPNRWANPLLRSLVVDESRASKTMVDMLTSYGTVTDPRLTLILSQSGAWVKGEADALQYRGVPNGLPVTDLSLPEYDNSHNSCIWGYMWGYDWNSAAKGSNVAKPNTDANFTPLGLMNYSEVCFLKAEAALRGWQGAGDAQANYEEGIRASFEEMRALAPEGSYSTTDDNTYITTGQVAWNNADDFEIKLEKIITQKWIGIYPNSEEAWAEFRRTGYPKLNPVKQSLEPTINPANNEFIKKLRYVDNELSNNKEYATDPTLNGGKGDGLSVRVWWDTARYK